MKNFILTILICWTFTTFGQKLDFSLSAGTGKTYIFESLDKSVNVKYRLPLSLITELKFIPKGRSWGLKLRMQHLQSSLTGENWVNKTPLDGYASSLITSLLLENEVTKNKSSYGFNFGLGITIETIQQQQYNPMDKIRSNYPSITLGGHYTHRLSNDFDFQIQPILLWQDPFKSIGVLTGKRKANFAREDLSALIIFGIRYKLFK